MPKEKHPLCTFCGNAPAMIPEEMPCRECFGFLKGSYESVKPPDQGQYFDVGFSRGYLFGHRRSRDYLEFAEAFRIQFERGFALGLAQRARALQDRASSLE